MSDLSSPALSLAPVEAAAAPWRWPTPPFAGYAAPTDRPGVACEIEGLTRTPIRAELWALDFECMKRECEQPALQSHPECVKMREQEDSQRERRQ